MMNIRTGGLLISLATAGIVGLAACGSGGDSSGSDESVPADALVVEALDIKFDQDQYTAPAGATDIAYVSQGQQVHTLVVFDANNQKIGETLKVNPGQTEVEAFDLPAGTYTLICDIPGHKDAGMVATLTTS
jgi:plastocyanin